MRAKRLKGEADELNREMWRLCNEENWDAVRDHLANGTWDPNRPLVLALAPGGFLLLSAAVARRNFDLARQLIQLGADVNARMPGDDTPLTIACTVGSDEIVELLLKSGADVNAKGGADDEGDSGGTPLMDAAIHGRDSIVDKLLQCGARIDATTRRGRSALSVLLEGETVDMEMVDILLNAGCPVDGRDLHYPIYHRNIELFRLLLERKPDVGKRFDWPTFQGSPKKGDTPLLTAVAWNGIEDLVGLGCKLPTKRVERLAIVDLLIAAGADVNAQRVGKEMWSPILLAVAQDDEEVVKRLLAAGADPTTEVFISRRVGTDGNWKVQKGPMSAITLAEASPSSKRIRMLLLGHE